MPKIALLDDYQKVALRMADWHRLPPEFTVSCLHEHCSDLDELAVRLADFEIICAMRERTPFPQALLQRLPKLRLLVTAGPKNASIDVAAAAKQGVLVCGTESLGHTTVEHTWALILALTRTIPHDHQALHTGQWQTRLGMQLHGKTLAILGLGRLGSRVAAIGQAFGMYCIAWSQNLTPEQAAACSVEYVTQDALLRRADILTIHLRLSERSRHLIGAAELALMQPSAFLINTSRGPIVAEQALLDALRERRIAGAGLDVFDQEPLPPEHPLLSLDNVVLTPHTGFVSDDTYRIFYGQMLEAIEAWLAGQPVRVVKP